jgi:hypothetical protein
MLDIELKFLASHRDDLLKQFGERVLVISGEEVTGAFDTLEEALRVAGEKHGLKDVLIRRPSEGQLEFSSNVKQKEREDIDEQLRGMLNDEFYQREALQIVEEFGG